MREHCTKLAREDPGMPSTTLSGGLVGLHLEGIPDPVLLQKVNPRAHEESEYQDVGKAVPVEIRHANRVDARILDQSDPPGIFRFPGHEDGTRAGFAKEGC